MSQVKAARVLLPTPPDDRFSAEDLIRHLPDPRLARSVSKASLLLHAVCRDLKSLLPQDGSLNFRSGVYCAVEAGPFDYRYISATRAVPEEKYHEAFGKCCSPKQYLKHLPNIAPAALGISLGITGPVHTFLHSLLGSVQALEQAELDLETGRVDRAIVCTAFSMEDPLITEKNKKAHGPNLIEGAAVVVLEQGGERKNWDQALRQAKNLSSSRFSSGIATPLMRWAEFFQNTEAPPT